MIAALFALRATAFSLSTVAPPARILSWLGVLLAAFIIIYIGLRPDIPAFVDMQVYSAIFHAHQSGFRNASFPDPAFNITLAFAATVGGLTTFYLLVSTLYVAPQVIAYRRWVGAKWPLALLASASTFSFLAYGTNTIRHGLAASFFLLAFSHRSWTMYLLFAGASVSFHRSFLIPAIITAVVRLWPNVKAAAAIWIACIPVSLFTGSFWNNLIAKVDVSDERISYLTTAQSADTFSRTGFRWDLIAYSAIGLAFSIVHHYRGEISRTYREILCAYLAINAAWILVIRANYTDRFAYLSWCLLPLVIVYPLLSTNKSGNSTIYMGGVALLMSVSLWIWQA